MYGKVRGTELLCKKLNILGKKREKYFKKGKNAPSKGSKIGCGGIMDIWNIVIPLLTILLWIFLISPWGQKFHFYAQNWFWGGVSIIASIYFGYKAYQSIDFSKPLLLSIYWETIGYSVLAIILFGFGVHTFQDRRENHYDTQNMDE